MNEAWILYIVLFAAVFLLIQGGYQFLGRDYAQKKQINRRISLIDANPNRAEVLETMRRERGIGSGGGGGVELNYFQRLMLQSGLRLTTKNILLAVTSVSFACVAASIFVLKFNILSIVVGILLAVMVLIGFLAFKRARRIGKFGEQLPEVLEIVVRSLRAGHPLPVSLALVAREMADPAGTEFGLTGDEIAYGLELRGALDNMSKRVGDPDLTFLITAISIQAQTGGNLADILSRLSKLLRDRFRLRRKVHSLSSEGRYSGLFLSMLPFIVFTLLNVVSPTYYSSIADNPMIPTIAGIALSLLAVGNFIMYKMINFKY